MGWVPQAEEMTCISSYFKMILDHLGWSNLNAKLFFEIRIDGMEVKCVLPQSLGLWSCRPLEIWSLVLGLQ